MNRARLLQHFDTLAETPDAVAKLRNFVLHLATRGILVLQNSADEPATELAKRIIALGQRIAKEQKIKLPMTEVAVTEADKKFRLPKGWAWVKLGDLCVKLGAGSTPLGGKRVYQNSGIKFLRSQNVWNEGLHLDDVALIAPAVHKDMDSTCVEPGDVLLNITGASIGRCAVVPDDFDEANVSQHVAIVRLADKGLRQFIHLIIIAPDFQSQIMQVQVGSALDHLTTGACPSPGAATSARTRASEKSNAPRPHHIAAPEDGRTPADFQKHAAFVLQHSDLVLDSVSQLRQAILALAVDGKLARQLHSDQPVETFLAEVAAAAANRIGNQLKDEADADPKFISHLPATLPIGWATTPLAHLFKFIDYRGRTPQKSSSGIRLITAKNVRRGFVSENPVEYLEPAYYSQWMTRGFPKQGDLLFVTEGHTMGFVGMIEFDFVFALGQRTINLQPHFDGYSGFFHLVLMSQQFQSAVQVNATGSAAKGIKAAKLKRIRVVVPPLAEQRRIVAKVDGLLRWCDALAARLTTAQTTAANLLDATLHQILTMNQRKHHG